MIGPIEPHWASVLPTCPEPHLPFFSVQKIWSPTSHSGVQCNVEPFQNLLKSAALTAFWTYFLLAAMYCTLVIAEYTESYSWFWNTEKYCSLWKCPQPSALDGAQAFQDVRRHIWHGIYHTIYGFLLGVTECSLALFPLEKCPGRAALVGAQTFHPAWSYIFHSVQSRTYGALLPFREYRALLTVFKEYPACGAQCSLGLPPYQNKHIPISCNRRIYGILPLSWVSISCFSCECMIGHAALAGAPSPVLFFARYEESYLLFWNSV